ncbi:MAG: DUF995 domain-containing protein [Gammaproteobacteria bacterium]|nr:DUF995 domain-containing protein [Gammaproteobacteria bacterium]
MKKLIRIFCVIGLSGMALVGCQTGGGGGPIETSLGSGAAPLTKAEMYKYFADQTQVRDGGGVYYSDYGTLVSLENKEKHDGTWGSYDGGKLCRHFKEREDPPCEVYYRNGDSVAFVMAGKTYVAPKLMKGDNIQLLLTGSARVLYTKEQATALISNKTQVWENFNGMYFAADGKAISLWDGSKESGKWWVNDEGGVCYLIPSWGREPCESFFDGDDGKLMSLYKGKEDEAAELREGNVLDSL